MLEVVGIVSDVRQAFGADPVAEMFVPYDQFPDALLTPTYLDTALVVRTAGEPLAVAPAVRGAVREIDPQQPLVNPRTMTSAMASTVAQQRFQMTLLTLFGSIAVALAAVGVYGVMAYTVSQRTAEISVRIAVGATPERVVAMVVWQGAQLAAMGVGLGLIAAALAAGAIQSLLYVGRGLAPLTCAGAPGVRAAAAVLARFVPARRAARVSRWGALNR
jgi:putative ABC transport system permease protein